MNDFYYKNLFINVFFAQKLHVAIPQFWLLFWFQKIVKV